MEKLQVCNLPDTPDCVVSRPTCDDQKINMTEQSLY